MREITSQELIDRIFQADKEELRKVMDAVTERFVEVWPDYELMVITAKGTTPQEHIEELERYASILKSMIKNDLP